MILIFRGVRSIHAMGDRSRHAKRMPSGGCVHCLFVSKVNRFMCSSNLKFTTCAHEPAQPTPYAETAGLTVAIKLKLWTWQLAFMAKPPHLQLIVPLGFSIILMRGVADRATNLKMDGVITGQTARVLVEHLDASQGLTQPAPEPSIPNTWMRLFLTYMRPVEYITS